MRNKLTDGAAHIEMAESIRRCRLRVLPERQKLRQAALLGRVRILAHPVQACEGKGRMAEEEQHCKHNIQADGMASRWAGHRTETLCRKSQGTTAAIA